MNNSLFTKSQIKQLKKNTNVEAVSELSITYTYEFQIMFIEEYINGRLPMEIFQSSGFDRNLIDINLIKNFRGELLYKH